MFLLHKHNFLVVILHPKSESTHIETLRFTQGDKAFCHSERSEESPAMPNPDKPESDRPARRSGPTHINVVIT